MHSSRYMTTPPSPDSEELPRFVRLARRPGFRESDAQTNLGRVFPWRMLRAAVECRKSDGDPGTPKRPRVPIYLIRTLTRR